MNERLPQPDGNAKVRVMLHPHSFEGKLQGFGDDVRTLFGERVHLLVFPWTLRFQRTW